MENLFDYQKFCEKICDFVREMRVQPSYTWKEHPKGAKNDFLAPDQKVWWFTEVKENLRKGYHSMSLHVILDCITEVHKELQTMTQNSASSIKVREHKHTKNYKPWYKISAFHYGAE